MLRHDEILFETCALLDLELISVSLSSTQLVMSRWKKSFTALAVLLTVECFSVDLFAGIFACAFVEANRLELVSTAQSDNHSVFTDDAGATPYGWITERGIGAQFKDVVLDQLFSRPIITPKVSRCISQSVLIL